MQKLFCIGIFYILFVVPSLQNLVCIINSDEPYFQCSEATCGWRLSNWTAQLYSYTAWVRIPAPTHIGCVSVGRLLNTSGLSFPTCKLEMKAELLWE